MLSVLIGIMLIMPANSIAKCAMIRYTVRGCVKVFRSFAPIENAQVLIFFDKAESTFSGGYDTKYPDFFSTSRNGCYENIGFFRPLESGSVLGGEKCQDNNPSVLEIIVLKARYITLRKIFTEREFKLSIISEKGEKVILLPDIFMREGAPLK